MNESEEKKVMTIQICCHCGKDVSWRSGLFVNRVPDFNDIFTRIANGRKFPLGDFVCRICDNPSDD